MFERLKLEEGWSTLLLVWSLIAVTAAAIVSAELTDSAIDVLIPVGTLGVFAGLLLAKSNFPARRAHLFALIYGLFVIAYAVGRILPGDLPWRLRVFDLVERQAVWMSKAVSGGISRDSIIFVLQTSVIFWIMGYTAAWYTFRRLRMWRVVLPTGLVLLSVVYYYYGPKPLVIYLGIYALLALLYIARSHLIDREKSWRSAAVRYEGEIRFDFLRASFLIGLVVLLLAGNLPALGASAEVNTALSGVDRPWKQFQDSWTRLFSSLRSYGTGTNDAYADTMVLGGPRSVGTTPIMDVYVPYRLPSVYWAGVVLDTYDGSGGWTNSTDKTVVHFPDEGALALPETTARRPITQTITNYIPNSSTIFGAPDIVGTDKQLLLDAVQEEGSDLTYNWIRSRYLLRQGDHYQVLSQVSTADKTSLRAAGAEYPQWVTGTYLQLPTTITPETKELAAELAAPYDNAFDKAIAIRDYLRANVAYNDQIPAPPEDVEPVHYTVFVSKEAYCTYYASAMAVMLRSQGIPTRIVNGYAQGEWLEDANVYRVRANNAHTWVEVYFPDFGWIQFEPTASLPVNDRPDGPPSGNSGDAFPNDPAESETTAEPFPIDDGQPDDVERLRDLLNEENANLPLTPDQRNARIIRAVGGGLLLLVAGGLVLVGNRINHQIERDVERSYGRLGSWARWLGINFRPVDTPYERADRLAGEVPEGRGPIRNLTREYVVRSFSPAHHGSDSFDPVPEWQNLRPLLLRRAIVQRLQRLRHVRLRPRFWGR